MEIIGRSYMLVSSGSKRVEGEPTSFLVSCFVT